jgi:isorenieratene synthase
MRFASEKLAQPGGSRPRLEQSLHVLVVGGGLAGAAAATVLGERGAAVTLLEREDFLGGRAGAWTDRLPDGEPFEMERGFHAFFRQYYNLRALLRRIDSRLHRLDPLEDYPLLGPGGARESFAALPRRTPLNIIELVRRTPRLQLSDLLRLRVSAAVEMLAYDEERTCRRFDAVTAREYLDSLNFPAPARQMLFDVFAHSFFNPEDQMSAADLLMMFHFYFTGNPEGLVFDVLCEPFSDGIWRPMRRYLEGLGVTVLLGRPATAVRRRPGGGWLVEAGAAGESPLAADALVLALDVPGLKALLDRSPELDDPSWRAAVTGLGVTLPFAVWRLWLDVPVHPDRAPFVGTTGLGLLDNISVYELVEGESRRWALRNGGSVVELHAYAVPAGLDEESIRADLRAGLHELYPEAGAARVLAERFLLRRDCPAFPPGQARTRPGVETPWPDLCLAGDFLRLPFPSALMERAVASGFLAANKLLARQGVEPEPVWSVPRRGLLARLF